jgi:hypothetical protein
LKIQAERGYLIPAIGSKYLDCANLLRNSILHWHPDANVTILTEDMLPFGNLGGFANDWQVFFASPYRQTIKLEADMYAASPIDHYWQMFQHRDVVVSTGARDFYDQLVVARHYRRFIDHNNLPDVYNAITYWRLSPTAKEFFETVRAIFENWDEVKKLLKYAENSPSTDFVYAIAAQILGPERVTLPLRMSPTVVHMKRYCVPIETENWTKELIWEFTDPGLRIHTRAQWGLVHYYIKEWANECR